MLGELPEDAQVSDSEEIFTPDQAVVIEVVTALDEVLLSDRFKDTRVLDILVALEALAGSIRETLGIAGMTELVEEEEDA